MVQILVPMMVWVQKPNADTNVDTDANISTDADTEETAVNAEASTDAASADKPKPAYGFGRKKEAKTYKSSTKRKSRRRK